MSAVDRRKLELTTEEKTTGKKMIDIDIIDIVIDQKLERIF